MRIRLSIIVLAVVFAGSVYANAAGPANVIHEDGTCSIGWFGCSLEDAVLQADGTYDCPMATVRLVFIRADRRDVTPNGQHGNVEGACDTRYLFNQPNPGGPMDPAAEVVAGPIETWCVFLPDACMGNGAVVANPRTIGSMAICGSEEGETTEMQLTVTPNGNARLRCSWPDPPQGE